jgi:hypothetical protein
MILFDSPFDPAKNCIYLKRMLLLSLASATGLRPGRSHTLVPRPRAPGGWISAQSTENIPIWGGFGSSGRW